MKALVTGGAGFIGSHIVERLLKEGNDVVVLDNFSSGKEENLSFVSSYGQSAIDYRLIRGDICDYDTCLRACKGIEIIFHQAALRSVPKSMNNPYEYNEVNINGTLNMLKAGGECGTKRLVFASSSSVYGDTDKFPEKETAYPLLISPYALTKLAGEYYCRIFSENFGLETVSLRYFNVFGPRQALDDEYAVVIPKFIHCILNNEQPPIFGNGKQSRDFTYIDNVVEANILAATVPLRDTQYAIRNTILNVANGKDNTVLSIVDSLNKIIGKNIQPEFLPVRKGDVFKTLADVSKIKSMLGFKPIVDFEQGLRRTVEYFKSQLVKG
ncbi:MAG: SDR family oxidoreductase [Candidatus Omnitrophica bacterium]|nr:SDR family oxidoreductase [Candidatus Omnitrophota bacterium]